MRKVSAARVGQFWPAQMETLNATVRVGRELTRETALYRIRTQHHYEVPGPAEHFVNRASATPTLTFVWTCQTKFR
jgi:hypothetical protein